ncbi:hypothetical protein GCM10017691_15060 [Pseudonocardia petroleophila]|uniref:Uncharacterized protein n=1 Tax=Pseudonocardia petroleophila TaxID=37331 RepID=A0A7G7MHZ7_9PSEU|nr:hypothetical protein [Pseudonocardia petroleophila]QNG52408.1 hypothetical protein H6H00_31030 [Pseudonocardia petroleophila]
MARTVTLSAAAVLALAGGVGWLVGSSALDAGTGTVVLAAGLGVTAWLFVVGSRDGAERPMERWRSRRLLRLAVIGLVVIVAGSALLGFTPYGELAVPLGFGVVGALLVPASSLLGDRTYLLLGAALMVLAALGAFLALNSVGQLYPRGLVGLGAGVLLWAASAHRSGLVAQLRGSRYR